MRGKGTGAFLYYPMARRKEALSWRVAEGSTFPTLVPPQADRQGFGEPPQPQE